MVHFLPQPRLSPYLDFVLQYHDGKRSQCRPAPKSSRRHSCGCPTGRNDNFAQHSDCRPQCAPCFRAGRSARSRCCRHWRWYYVHVVPQFSLLHRCNLYNANMRVLFHIRNLLIWNRWYRQEYFRSSAPTSRVADHPQAEGSLIRQRNRFASVGGGYALCLKGWGGVKYLRLFRVCESAFIFLFEGAFSFVNPI